MECGEVREEFSALIDGELAPEQRRAVEAHLTQCSECLRELDRIKRIDVLYRGLAPQTARIGFEEGVNRAVLAASETRRRPRMRLWPRLLPVVAAAALLLVVLGATVLRTGRDAARMAQTTSAPAAQAMRLEVAKQPEATRYVSPERAVAGDGATAMAGASPKAKVGEKVAMESLGSEAGTRRVLADGVSKQEAMKLKGGVPTELPEETTIAAERVTEQPSDKLAEKAPSPSARETVGAAAELKPDEMAQQVGEQEAVPAAPAFATPPEETTPRARLAGKHAPHKLAENTPSEAAEEAAKSAVEPEPKVMDKSGREEIEVSAAPARAAHRLAAEPVLSAPPMPRAVAALPKAHDLVEPSMPSAAAPEAPAMVPPPPMSAEKASMAAAAPPPSPAPRAEARMAPVPPRVPALAEGAPASEKAGEAGSQAHVAMAGPAAKTQEAAGRYVARGDNLREQGELTRAIENYKSALDLEPKNVNILVKLGETLLQNGKKKEALRQLQQAVKVEPRSVAAQCSLARALESAGRVDEAVEHLQKALEIDPSSAQAKEALERLKPAPKKP
jgi:tetratricopeptide (TPR) repeat protein/anti-sigma factor RsiW